MITTKDDIFAIVQSKQAKLRALGVKRLGLFGSFVRGEQKPESDVDFLVEFEPDTKTFSNFMNVWDVLEDAVNRPVDVLTVESLATRPCFQKRVLKDAQFIALR